jgi:diguanylate cyclase (GGDEF)-like protein/PAS domain S-box-containing protein
MPAIRVAESTVSNATVQALLVRESRFSDLLRNMEVVAVMLDRRANIIFCNDYFLRLTGWQREEILGRNYIEIFSSSAETAAQDDFSKVLDAAPDSWNQENELITRSGGRRIMRWTNVLVRSGSGSTMGSASIGEDITERKQAEAQIAYLSRMQAVLSGINTLIVRVRDRGELFREACRIAVEVGGLALSLIAVLDRSVMKMIPVGLAGKDPAIVADMKIILATDDRSPNAMVEQMLREKRAVVSNDSQNDPHVAFRERHVKFGSHSMAIVPLLVADEVVGVIALYATEINFFHEEEIKLLTELAADIAFSIDHIEKLERLDYLAYYDALSGLANRRLFLDRVGQHLRSAADKAQRLAVFVIDLERFKNINHSLGRSVGDAILKQVADWLVVSSGGDASLLSHLGADHFAAVMPEVPRAYDLQHRVRKAVQEFSDHEFRHDNSVFRIGCRVGVALFPEDGATADSLLKNAEAALSKAKAAGDRYLFYSQTMSETLVGRLSMEMRLRLAIDRNEFVLHYQPKVNLRDSSLTGAEALIRWNDPERGLTPPAQFIPILEETGLIYEVGRWALRTAIADYLRWCGSGPAAAPVSVNVSLVQLRSSAFVADLQEAIGVDARAAAGLELEITESVIMKDVKLSIETLRAIRAMGVKISIDDFGTGFSSLSSLAKLPINTIKIDRSFVTDMAAGPEGLALVSMIVTLARSLKLKVVAEGVETEDQANLLRLLSCDEAQGHLFCKPLPIELFEEKYVRTASGSRVGAFGLESAIRDAVPKKRAP